MLIIYYTKIMKQFSQFYKTKYFQVFFAVFAFLVVYYRRTEIILDPQFWAEDGAAWFANAYNIGALKSLFLVQDGYFQSLSRIVAIIAMSFPIIKAPLIFNFSALIVQILPAVFLLSSRFEKLISNFNVRILLVSLYLFLPNTAEVSGNITNAQWFLALLAFMILIAKSSDRKLWKIFDFSVLVLAGLSGPFSILLLPVAFFVWFYKRKKYYFQNFIIIFSTAAVQIFGIFYLDSGERIAIIPDFTVKLFFSIFGRQVVWGSLIGINGYVWVLNNISWYFIFFSFTTFLALLLSVYALFKAPFQLKLFIMFSLLIFISSLISPTGLPKDHELEFLSRATTGMRYWIIPMCSFLVTLVWGLSKKNHIAIKIISAMFLMTAIYGAIVDFYHPKFIDYQFRSEIEKFENLPLGHQAFIPINPYGWEMELIKR